MNQIIKYFLISFLFFIEINCNSHIEQKNIHTYTVDDQINQDHLTKIKESHKKNVLLTGAAGFIGSNFLRHMFDKYPDYNFLVLDALTYAGSLDNIPRYIRKSHRFEFYYGSVTNYQLVEKLMARANLVVHFAAESHVTKSICDDITFFETDVIGTRVMMTALVKYKKTVERFIHISTSEVLGTAETTPMSEDHPINPRSPYAAAKAGADRLVYSYCCTYQIPAVIVRPFNNYGPQQHLEKVIPRFIVSAIKNQPLTVHGDGSQARDWLHTDDLAIALDMLLHTENFNKIKNTAPEHVIHIGTGIGTTILDIAKMILEYFNLPESNLKFTGDRPGQVRYHCSSTDKANKLLHWKHKIELKEGLPKTIRWYLDNQERWEKMEETVYTPVYTNGEIIELQ